LLRAPQSVGSSVRRSFCYDRLLNEIIAWSQEKSQGYLVAAARRRV